MCQAASMDLAPTEHEDAFRADVRAWLVDNLPWEYGQGLPPRFEDLAEEVGVSSGGGSGTSPVAAGSAWPGRCRCRGLGCWTHRALHRAERSSARSPGPRNGRSDRAEPGRSDPAGPRYRAAEVPLAGPDPVRRGPVVPAVQ